MLWHFPNSGALESSIRIGDYKLVRNYDHVTNPKVRELELYRLYNSENGKQVRADIEEAKDLVEAMPEKAEAMNRRLSEILTEMKASYPYHNPHCPRVPNREKAPAVLAHKQAADTVEFTYREKGAKVLRANLIYTLNGGRHDEEWFREPATLLPGLKVSARLPQGTTHYVVNLIDENNFLVSYPEMDETKRNKMKAKYSALALKAAGAAVAPASPASSSASAVKN
jgi:uncharacterized sulfatase